MKDDQARVGNPVDNGEHDIDYLESALVDKFVKECLDDNPSFIVESMQNDLAEYISATPRHLAHIFVSMLQSKDAVNIEYSKVILGRVAYSLVANDPDLVEESL
jgi:hypothetical protein